ncbi:hypothetical protein K6025_02995 [Ehrlichia sp. JZT12]
MFVTSERSELIDDSILSIIVKIIMVSVIHNILIIGPRGKLLGPLLL